MGVSPSTPKEGAASTGLPTKSDAASEAAWRPDPEALRRAGCPGLAAVLAAVETEGTAHDTPRQAMAGLLATITAPAATPSTARAEAASPGSGATASAVADDRAPTNGHLAPSAVDGPGAGAGRSPSYKAAVARGPAAEASSPASQADAPSRTELACMAACPAAVARLLELLVEPLLVSFLSSELDEEGRPARVPSERGCAHRPGSVSHGALAILVAIAGEPAGVATLRAHPSAADDFLAVASFIARPADCCKILSAMVRSGGGAAVGKAVRRQQLLDSLYSLWASQEQEGTLVLPRLERPELPIQPPLAQAAAREARLEGAGGGPRTTATVASLLTLIGELPELPDGGADPAGVHYPTGSYEPYEQYGPLPFYRAFAAHARLMTRVVSCFWQSSPSRWPDALPRHTPADQRSKQQTMRGMAERLRALRSKLKAARGEEEEEARNLCKKTNREAAGIIYGIESTVFDTLAERRIFSVSKEFAEQAGRFDASLSRRRVLQGGRNVWTCFALQVIYNGNTADCHSAISSYSLMYPYTDNFLDDPECSLDTKLAFQEAFRRRLSGCHSEADKPSFHDGRCAFDLVQGIEAKWDRSAHPEVFCALAAINDAQTWSLWQHGDMGAHTYQSLLEQTAYKGGTSVLADAYLVDGRISLAENAFAFCLGFVLQLVDDLQDLGEDLEEGQHTMFTIPVQRLATQDRRRRQSSKAASSLRRRLSFAAHKTGLAASASTSTAKATPGVGDGDGRRLAFFLSRTIMLATNPSLDVKLRELMLSMTWNSTFRAIAASPRLFSAGFTEEWAPFVPLPQEDMPRLHSMSTMLKMAFDDLI